MDRHAKIFVAGHRGLAGSALMRRLEAGGFDNLITRGRQRLDLCNQAAVADFFFAEKPDYVLLAAARVGGILANSTYPADFIRDNLSIQTNVIHASFLSGVRKLLFLGSSCIYPRDCPQPMKEQSLLTGPLEPTNAAYAVAKIAGIQMCRSYNLQHGTFFIPVMPTNLYGPNDNFHLSDAHVLPALMHRFHNAKVQGADEVVVWGSGTARREFLFADDMADACLFLLQRAERPELINIGTGREVTIAELARMVKAAVGFEGRLVFDAAKPDGMPRKLLDVGGLAAMGWKAPTGLAEGIAKTYRWFCDHYDRIRK